MATLTSRRAGLLLPVASLPGPYGIGDLGPSARSLVAWLASAGQRIWQILPLSVVDAHGCPYASPSAFARDPLYLSLDDLVDDGFLERAELPAKRETRLAVDWNGLRAERTALLVEVGRRIARSVDLDPFVEREPWVVPWSRFAALKTRRPDGWPSWPAALRDRPLAESFDDTVPDDALPHLALQWALDRQWKRLHQLARAFDVQIWGDLPFFVGLDSADVWANRHLFAVDAIGRPTAITGVPPDAFSADGQLWGHPQLVREAHEAEDWRWWRSRIQVALRSLDVLRIDHFRGLESVWSVPAEAESAAEGAWIPGPGPTALQGFAPERLLAEDLGIITPAVRKLRDDAGLPGMAVLQFAFGPGGEAHFLPHAHERHQVVYTGTHDNDTLAGWLATAGPATHGHLRAYFGDTDPHAALLRAAWRSVARHAILPLQDVLGLGSTARFNTPGTLVGNWCWRSGPVYTEGLAGRLAFEAIVSHRQEPR